MNRRSSWREFGFNPVACHPLIRHTLERTSKLWATSLAPSARFFWASPSEVYDVLRPSTWFVLFQPWGLDRATWDSSLSLCVRLFTLRLLCIMSSASPASVFCGWTHWPRPDQLMGRISASPVSDLCGNCCRYTTGHRGSSSPPSIYLSSSCGMLLCSAGLLCFCPQFIVNSDSLITVKCC